MPYGTEPLDTSYIITYRSYTDIWCLVWYQYLVCHFVYTKLCIDIVIEWYGMESSTKMANLGLLSILHD